MYHIGEDMGRAPASDEPVSIFFGYIKTWFDFIFIIKTFKTLKHLKVK